MSFTASLKNSYSLPSDLSAYAKQNSRSPNAVNRIDNANPRHVAVQTYVPQCEYISPQVRASQPIVSYCKNVSWFYRPHTVTVLCLSIFLIWIYSHIHGRDRGLRLNLIAGVLASVCIFLVFCVLQFPDGILIRPAKAFWRFVKGVSVLYLCLLVFLLFQDLFDVRNALSLIDNKLEKTILEKNYAEDCRIYISESKTNPFANVFGKIDIFVFAHLFGWIIKAVVIRDTKLLWFLSVFFEWMEISLRHILPNFYECWWDHLIFDIFGCNLIGIYLGMKLCKLFELKEYTWKVKGTDENNVGFSTSATLKNFMPYKWTAYRWPAFLSNYETFIGLLVFSFCATQLDLNVFFLKAELLLPSSHWINVLRLGFWTTASASGTREFYEYMRDKNNRRMGVQCWLDFAMVLCELLLVIKWCDGISHIQPCPSWILVIWSILIFCIIFIIIWLYLFPSKIKST